MRIFLDTANIDTIRQAAQIGIISGVTTNPTLLAKTSSDKLEISWDFYKTSIQEICSLISGPVSAEVLSQERAGMIEEARELSTWAENVVIKIPATWEGIAATSTLAKEGIRVNITLCFSLNQALLGALAGASFISPFVGRLDDVGEDGMKLVADIIQVYNNYNFPTEVIAASLRHPHHCIAAAKAGAHIATVPYEVLTQMVQHPMTDIGISRFLKDWHRTLD